MPMKLGFFRKITAHIVFMTLFAGVTITAVTAFQFRRDMYRLEYDSAYMVYSAAAQFLAERHDLRRPFPQDIISRMMTQQSLRLHPRSGTRNAHRPRQVVIYDAQGLPLHEFRDADKQPPAEPLPPDHLPDAPQWEHTRFSDVIAVTGPIDPENPSAGYVRVRVQTNLREQMEGLVSRSLLMLIVVVSLTAIVSLFFTRQILAPVRALTRAAHAVHRGDLQQHVPVSTDDEIGELAVTFNEMVQSMDRRLDVMHRMQDWTMRIGRQLDARQLFHALGEMFERMSMASSYRLYLHNPETKQLEVRLEYGADGLPGPDEDKLARIALRERWTMYLRPDGQPDNEPNRVSELAIPLLSGKHRVGVIRIGRKSDGALYDDDTLTTLQTLAQHASVAIDNASLYERLAAQERMAQEMILARQIQQSMLPRVAPAIPGYEIVGGSSPALEVGGDYFDYVQRDGNQYIFIGDVSGKGVPAALIMSIVRALIRTYLEFEPSPGSVLCKVNRNISQDLDPEMFVTMSGLELDPVHHRLVVARAGHEPVLVIQADGTARQITPSGSALGLLPVSDFEQLIEETTYAIQPGDTVLLYTDGITEAQNADGEEFGYDRLKDLMTQNAQLPVQTLHTLVRDEVQAFAAGMTQLDDITLIILRRTGSA